MIQANFPCTLLSAMMKFQVGPLGYLIPAYFPVVLYPSAGSDDQLRGRIKRRGHY